MELAGGNGIIIKKETPTHTIKTKALKQKLAITDTRCYTRRVKIVEWKMYYKNTRYV